MQTLTSTSVVVRARARITSSVTSVETFEAFWGQLTQITPSLYSAASVRGGVGWFPAVCGCR